MTSYTEAHRQYYLNNKTRILKLRKEREKKWISTPKGKFSIQKRKAKQRGLEWKLSFEEWWDLWQSSGKWDQRGDNADSYCMCRTNDTGPYELGNVRIDTFSNNTKELYERVGVDKLGRFNSI